MPVRNRICTGCPRPSSQHKGDLPQRAGDKRQRQEIEDEGEGEGNKGGPRVGDKGLPLDREETDVAHRQMAVYKGKGRKHMLG